LQPGVKTSITAGLFEYLCASVLEALPTDHDLREQYGAELRAEIEAIA
jgi:hypothetical protein